MRKVTLLFGATGSVGRVVYMRLLGEDRNVIAIAHTPEAGEKFKQQIPDYPAEVMIADVTCVESIESLNRDFQRKSAEVEAIIYLAGRCPAGGMHRIVHGPYLPPAQVKAEGSYLRKILGDGFDNVHSEFTSKHNKPPCVVMCWSDTAIPARKERRANWISVREQIVAQRQLEDMVKSARRFSSVHLIKSDPVIDTPFQQWPEGVSQEGAGITRADVAQAVSDLLKNPAPSQTIILVAKEQPVLV